MTTQLKTGELLMAQYIVSEADLDLFDASRRRLGEILQNATFLQERPTTRKVYQTLLQLASLVRGDLYIPKIVIQIDDDPGEPIPPGIPFTPEDSDPQQNGVTLPAGSVFDTSGLYGS
jgi:hypothetical protein